MFFLIRSIPGDIVTKMVAQHRGVWKDADSAAVKARLGLDVPSPVQYGRWIGVIRDQHGSFSGLLQGSLGLSLWRQEPVTGIVLNQIAGNL